MFRKKDRNNPVISRMRASMKTAIEGSSPETACAKEIIPLLKALFNKCMNTVIKWDGQDLCWSLEEIFKISGYIAQNTRRSSQRLTDEDLSFIKKLFEELYVLYAEAVKHYLSPHDLGKKIDCIQYALSQNAADSFNSRPENWQASLIFQNYGNLWKIIHRLNTEWDELCLRGFCIGVLSDYFESVAYSKLTNPEKSEDEHINDFMELLDGKKKFIPLYEERPVCYAIVPVDHRGKIIKYIKDTNYSTSYRLIPKDTGTTTAPK